ncbi:hypothetical protein LguiB_012630 [Lonicera macranthoides]
MASDLRIFVEQSKSKSGNLDENVTQIDAIEQQVTEFEVPSPEASVITFISARVSDLILAPGVPPSRVRPLEIFLRGKLTFAGGLLCRIIFSLLFLLLSPGRVSSAREWRLIAQHSGISLNRMCFIKVDLKFILEVLHKKLEEGKQFHGTCGDHSCAYLHLLDDLDLFLALYSTCISLEFISCE